MSAATATSVRSSIVESSTSTTVGLTAAAEQDDQRVVRLVVALLVVVGLLIGLLTWRYWHYTDPRRGLAPSRARLPRRLVAPADVPQPPLETDVEVVEAETVLPSTPDADERLAVSASRPASAAPIVSLADEIDPTDPGMGALPRQPVGSD